MTSVAAVFVHGFLSSPATWSRFVRLIREDPSLAGLSVHPFGYSSPAMSLHPLRRIPSLDDVADSLRTFLAYDLADRPRLVLVSHSQGGLVVQRLLARTLADGDARELSRIRLIVMYACPHAGSDLALPLRRWAWFWRNRQEQELRPLHATVAESQRIVLNRVVHAERPTTKIRVYAGASDAIVPPASARSVFPNAGMVPGDHFSIIQPDSHSHRSYTVLRHDLLALLAEPADAPVPPPLPPPPGADPGAGLVPPPRPPAEDADLPQPSTPPVRLTPPEYGLVVERLMSIPDMADPAFRQRLYGLLPGPVRGQLPRNSVAQTELIGVAQTLCDYHHLASWDALAEGVRSLVPAHPAVDRLVATLTELALIAPPRPR